MMVKLVPGASVAKCPDESLLMCDLPEKLAEVNIYLPKAEDYTALAQQGKISDSGRARMLKAKKIIKRKKEDYWGKREKGEKLHTQKRRRPIS